MILIAGATYPEQVQAAKQRKNLDAEGIKQAIEKLRPDFRKRSGIRCVDDGTYLPLSGMDGWNLHLAVE